MVTWSMDYPSYSDGYSPYHQINLIPASLTSSALIAICLRTMASSCSGLSFIGTMPYGASLLFTVASAFVVSSCILLTIARGVLAGTKIMFQNGYSVLGNPASAMVGTSGSTGVRLSLATASAISE